jgi:prepilin-type N-terminal cleavage/methylation domain-containing protein
MPVKMKRNNRGFTIVEIVVVMVLISIIAAAVFRRSITTDEMNLVSQFDKIQNQVRYPQSMAMKQGREWGFACDGGDYWIFTGTNKDTVSKQRLLPGQENIKISLTGLGVTMTPASFTVIFNSYGIPFWPNWNTPLATELQIDIKDAELNTRSFKILPETGLVK